MARARNAAAVADVPTDYVYRIFHSESGASNDVYSKQDNGRFSQSDLEGGNGAPFRSAGDPRTPWTQDPLGGFDETIPLFTSDLYTAFADDHPLALGVEARLIEAEAELQAGDHRLRDQPGEPRDRAGHAEHHQDQAEAEAGRGDLAEVAGGLPPRRFWTTSYTAAKPALMRGSTSENARA